MPRRGLVLLAVLVFLPASCSDDDSSSEAFMPTFDEVDCPSELQVANLAPLSCGYLTVLEDRVVPDGPTVRIFVVRTDPPDAEPQGTTLSIDNDLGDGGAMGAGPGAARTHSVVYQIDPRGTGRSEPSLACPEVDALAVEAAEAPSSSTAFRDRFQAAIIDCRDRLVEEGIDPVDYDIEQSAADIEDLREVLDIGRWNLAAQGTYSRYELEVARRWPEHVDDLFFDSPQFPGTADPEVAIEGLDHALEQLADACDADEGYAATTPDLVGLLSEATERLDREPVSFRVTGGHLADLAGRPVMVLVDGAKLLRAVRATLGGDGPAGLLTLPATIADAARGRVSEQLAAVLSNEPVLCAGYRPMCASDPGTTFSLGVYLTSICRDQAPFIDGADATGVGPADAAREIAYGQNPYLAACAAWDVPPADAAVDEPVANNVPALMVTGQFDSYSPAPVAADAADHLPNGHALEIPGQTHNVMGFGECQIEIRNAWILDPERPPRDTSCLEDLRSTALEFAAAAP